MNRHETDITAMSASRLSEAIRRRQVPCVDVMKAYLEKIHRTNPVYNAIVAMVDDEILMERAEAADRALGKGEYWGWMHGMPHAVKDLASVEGLVTSFGSRVFAGTVAGADDLHVARIRNQGAIFIGKTNSPEFGLGSQTYNPVYGTTRNAYDSRLTAGGSSGGAAAGLALGILPVADGSDMMGSLRNPAGYNNIVGFRPSQGRVPSVPAVPGIDVYYHQLAIDGPMGRTVEDTIRLLVTMAGHDPRAPLSLRDELPAFEAFSPVDLKAVRIGWMGDYEGYLATEPGLLALCRAGLETIVRHGATVAPCRPDYDMARLWQTWLTLRHWIIGSHRPLYDNPQTKKLLKPELVWEIEGCFDMPASRLTEAARARTDWYRALLSLFEDYDLLALPSAQVFPFPAEIHWPDHIAGKAMDTYHRWMEVVIGGTLAGLPVVSLPAGFDDRGRPMGLQFMGPMGHDRRVLEFALAYEAATDHLARRPALPPNL